MVLCEFCRRHEAGGRCRVGLKMPKGMGCREFDPGMERFCSDIKDFVSPGQIIGMATYFGIKGTELKKVKLMTAREERNRP